MIRNDAYTTHRLIITNVTVATKTDAPYIILIPIYISDPIIFPLINSTSLTSLFATPSRLLLLVNTTPKINTDTVCNCQKLPIIKIYLS